MPASGPAHPGTATALTGAPLGLPTSGVLLIVPRIVRDPTNSLSLRLAFWRTTFLVDLDGREHSAADYAVFSVWSRDAAFSVAARSVLAILAAEALIGGVGDG